MNKEKSITSEYSALNDFWSNLYIIFLASIRVNTLEISI